MKHLLLCPDGASDWPIGELGDKTPLEAAHLPNIARLAREGRVGRTQHAQESVGNGSDVCCMSMLGFDPVRYHTGRAPIEAKAMGVDLADDDIAVRCNTVTIEDNVMVDYSAGHISSAESKRLIEALQSTVGREGRNVHAGVQYRHLLVLRSENGLDVDCTPPHDIIGRDIGDYLPKGPDAACLLELMDLSKGIFKEHPVNQARRSAQKNPATQVWLWGSGPRPSLPSFRDTFGRTGAVISAVDLLRSLGLYVGLDVLEVPGITGFTDTNYAGKGKAAIEALADRDLVFLHVEAPDECGHMGDAREKVASLERIDADIVGPILESESARSGHLHIMVCPDHATPCALKTHATEPVPFLVWGPGISPGGLAYTETDARRSEISVSKGHEMMKMFLDNGFREGDAVPGSGNP